MSPSSPLYQDSGRIPDLEQLRKALLAGRASQLPGPEKKRLSTLWHQKDRYTRIPLQENRFRFPDPQESAIVPFMHGIYETRTPSHLLWGELWKEWRYGVVFYTLTGEGIAGLGRRRFRLTPGTAYLTLINNPHSFHVYAGAEPAEPWRFYALQLRGGLGLRMVGQIIGEAGPVVVFDAKDPSLARFLSDPAQPRLQEPKSPLEGAQWVSDLLLAYLYSARSSAMAGRESGNPSFPQEPGGHASLIVKAEELMAALAHTPIVVKDIARMLGVSREHLTRVYGLYRGRGPHAQLLEERLRIARDWLWRGGLTLKEVAQRSGFAHADTLRRAYLRRYGAPPGF